MRKYLAPMFAIPLVALLIASPAQAAGPISNVTYKPNPLYNDEVTVTISFVASRKARPGYEWGVMMTIYGKEPVLSCASILSSWDPAFGGRKNRHIQRAGRQSVLLVGRTTGLEFICRGRAKVRVVEHKIGSPGLGKWYGPDGSLDFRVAEAP